MSPLGSRSGRRNAAILGVMYATFFGLDREPFSLAPDPRFLFMSERHREALAHLLYGVGGGGGFVLLTGEIGAGKTTVARCFLEQLPTTCVVAYIFNPCLSVIELLQTVCSEFGIAELPASATGKAHVDALNRFLLDAHAKGRQALLIIDEAQALEPAVLEQLRLLTNLETAERKLLQIVLIGQPELRTLLAEPGLEQLAQRVIARYHLGPLSASETRQYVEHRLSVAGLRGPSPFEAVAQAQLYRQSGGVPRRINLLADRALLGAYSQSRRQVDRLMVARAAEEVFDRRSTALWERRRAALLITLALAVALTAAAWMWSRSGAPALPDVATTAPASPQAKPDPTKQQGAGAVVVDATGLAASAASATPAGLAAPTQGSPASSLAPALDALPSLLVAAHADEATAWRELALRWNVAIGEGDPCVAAGPARLACFKSATGGVQLLRLLARPAILSLRQPGGLRVHAVLVGLGASQASLQVGGQRFEVPLASLASVWRGEFATLWRTPEGWRAGGGGDLTGLARSWAQAQMSKALPGASERSWAEQVSAFQVLNGLPSDGQAGPMTLMQLNRSAGVDEPLLNRLQER